MYFSTGLNEKEKQVVIEYRSFFSASPRKILFELVQTWPWSPSKNPSFQPKVSLSGKGRQLGDDSPGCRWPTQEETG